MILLVAMVMAIATWPLMKLRRLREVGATEAVIIQHEANIKNYQLDHGVLDPPSMPPPLQGIRDAWGRPFRYRCPGIHNKHSFDLWSLGPDPDDPSDDIGNWPRSGSP